MSLFGPVNTCGCSVLRGDVVEFLPQVSLQAHATVLSSAARTTLTQTFFNPSEFILEEVSYRFPLYDGVSVVGFKCQVGTRLLVSKVKSKDQANAEYKQAVERHEAAAIMDHSMNQSDVFNTRVGNVPAHEKVVIEITFVGELKQDAQMDGVRYTLPNAIAPRYGPSALFSHQPEKNPTFQAQLTGITITADVLLEKSSIIREIQSPSHLLKVSLGRTSVNQSDSRAYDPCQASASLKLGNEDNGTKPLLEKDFVLVVKADGLDNPRAMLETHPTLSGQRALMATLVPKFNLPAIKPEIIFVIDRSGSMHGNIPTLRAALRVFLKSLPLGVCFNICSFGSHYSFLWPNSKVYDKSSLEDALVFVDTVEANMGGTETYSAVEASIGCRLPNKDLELLLLTDGQIGRQNDLFDLLRQTSAAHTARCFTLGIGNGVSHSLIEGTARAGQGFAQTILREEELDRCVVRMLKGALTPHIYDYKIEVDYENMVEQDFEIVSESELSMTEKEVESREPTVSPAPAQSISLFSEDFKETEVIGSEPTEKDADLPKITAPKSIQAPYKIPPLYPFIRSTVYLLLDPESSDKTPKSLTFTATSKQGPLCLRISISDIGKGETIHQLASRKAVVELEELHGWLADVKDESGNPFDQLHHGTKDRIAARECQTLGIKYQVTGKYCSFVALEKNANESTEEEEYTADGGEPLQWTVSPGDFGTKKKLRARGSRGSSQKARMMSASSSVVSQHQAFQMSSVQPPPAPSGRPSFGSFATRGGLAPTSSPVASAASAGASSGPLFGNHLPISSGYASRGFGASAPPAASLPQHGGGLFGSNQQSQQALRSAAPTAESGSVPELRAPASSTGPFFSMALPRQPGGLFGSGSQPPNPPPGGFWRRTPHQQGDSPFRGQPSAQQSGGLFGGQHPQQQSSALFRGQPSSQQTGGDSAGFGSPVVAAHPRALFGGRPPNQQNSGPFSTPAPRTEDSTPKSKVHALVGAQTFEGSWIWDDQLFSIMGYKMEDVCEKVAMMLQNDGKRDTLNERESNVVATLIAMGWLKREHSDLKDVWDLVYAKAKEWVENEISEMSSELLHEYEADAWMNLI